MIIETNENGDWHGEIKQYDTLGLLEYSGDFENGLKHGVSIWYYPHGDIMIQENYTKGYLNGIVQKYDSLGRLYLTYDYELGKLLNYKRYDSVGNLTRQFIYLDSTNAPLIKDAVIKFDRDTSDFYSRDTIRVDIKIPGLPSYQINPRFSNARWMIDYQTDSFNIWFQSRDQGITDMYLYVRSTDTSDILLGKLRYNIKEKTTHNNVYSK